MSMPHPLMYDDGDPVLRRLRTLCMSLSGTVETINFGRPWWRVGKKAYANYAGRSGHVASNITFKATKLDQQALVQDGRFAVAPYIGHQGWTVFTRPERLDWDEIEGIVRGAYALVAPKPKGPRAARR
ncbi:MAG: MmcQ/YjbR family DNA-binding protein [SAR202 cluster bacterium]|nr:MmcQ/YjbR family DNA-binding protein [SAR202 cluster bacterium]